MPVQPSLACGQGRRRPTCAGSPARSNREGPSLGSGGESVEIRSASKSYGAVRALDNVTLKVAPREFVSLLGPSGSGKTTLLGLLGGFIQPSSGSIHFGDRDVTFLPPHKARHRRRVSELRAVSAHERRRERRLPAPRAPPSQSSLAAEGPPGPRN